MSSWRIERDKDGVEYLSKATKPSGLTKKQNNRKKNKSARKARRKSR